MILEKKHKMFQVELRNIKLELAQELRSLNNTIKISNIAGIPAMLSHSGYYFGFLENIK